MELKRCGWCTSDPLYIDYHDNEWGDPVYDSLKLFEFLNLEGQQAGLSWITILKKREAYKKAYASFNPKKLIHYNQEDIANLLNNPAIIRNKMKIHAILNNAKAFLEIEDKQPFHEFIWQFVNGEPIQNEWKSLDEIPNFTKESQLMSKELKKRGFKFIGPTICYAFMQAVGMVNDHIKSCYRYDGLK